MSNYNHLAPALIMLFAVMRIAVFPIECRLQVCAGHALRLSARHAGKLWAPFGGALSSSSIVRLCSPPVSARRAARHPVLHFASSVLCSLRRRRILHLRLVSVVRRAPDLPRVNITRHSHHLLQVMGLLYYLLEHWPCIREIRYCWNHLRRRRRSPNVWTSRSSPPIFTNQGAHR